jgi:hypothetical protein
MSHAIHETGVSRIVTSSNAANTEPLPGASKAKGGKTLVLIVDAEVFSTGFAVLTGSFTPNTVGFP